MTGFERLLQQEEGALGETALPGLPMTVFERLLLLAFIFALLIFQSGCATNPRTSTKEEKQTAPQLERVVVSTNGPGFALSPSGRKFIPLGHNYGNKGRLMEDFWDTDWLTIEKDFQKLREMGANVVRVHLQFGKFMTSAVQPNPAALQRLRQLANLAEKENIYLDVTGLGCYRKADIPVWYDGLQETNRWRAQAVFWRAVARTCSSSPAIFCYDLMNEPLVGDKRKPRDWYSGALLGGYDFLQFITLDKGPRERVEAARQWIRFLSETIRAEDTSHLITVGLLPWTPKWGHMSGFIPAQVAPELSFVSVHIYPERGEVPEALNGLRQFVTGKPLVIEETFPLSCGIDELKEFLDGSRSMAQGWIGHYDGLSIAELDAMAEKKEITIPQSLYQQWLKLAREFSGTLQ